MFVHGREAYRRNSFLISYTFYKNVLYVVAQYFFGFHSAFSGQPLYEAFIYQLYNITMTSIPIMYYALFDFEYEKDYSGSSSGQKKSDSKYLMRNPMLYKVGMESQLYGTKQFVQWLLYAMWHALAVYFVCFYALTQSHAYLDDSGKEIGFWVAGHVVYGGCIFIANMLILMRFNNLSGVGEITVGLMIISYFLFLGLESLIRKFPEVSGIF